MYESNEISVSKKQKIIAYIFLFLIIITFSTMRSYKTKMTIEKNYNLTKSVEKSISESISYLYNDDILTTNCNYIDNKYKERLVGKFKEANKLMTEESLKLSTINFNAKKVYKTKIKGEPFIIYSGKADLKWSYTNKEVSTDTITKEITVYLTEDNDTFFVADINLKDVQ